MEHHYDVAWRSGPRIIEDGTPVADLRTALFVAGSSPGDFSMGRCGRGRRPPTPRKRAGGPPGCYPCSSTPWRCWRPRCFPARCNCRNTPRRLDCSRAPDLVSAILLCSLRDWRGRASGIWPASRHRRHFLFFLYRDTAALNRMENQAENYVRAIPPANVSSPPSGAAPARAFSPATSSTAPASGSASATETTSLPRSSSASALSP